MNFNQNKKNFLFVLCLILSVPLQAESIREKPHFEFSASTLNAEVNSPNQIWDFSSLSIYRKNSYGAFGIGANYANRLGNNAWQGYINLIPKIGDSLWLDLTYGNSNTPQLFPDDRARVEVFKKFGKGIVISGGGAYNKIHRTYFNTYTASIAKYIGYYYFEFRPYHFIPKSGPESTLFRFEARTYWDNPDKYIGVSFATGTSPDLFDLLTVPFIKVKNNIVMLEGQQPINDMTAFKLGAGYETQKYPSGFLRQLYYFNLGIKIRVA